MGAKKALSNNPSNDGKKFIGKPRPSKLSMGIDGSLDENLMFQYCKETGHELDNCKWLQQKLASEHAAMWSIVTEGSLNTNHHW